MERWILEQNLERFNEYLASETHEASRRTRQSMIMPMRRETAAIVARAAGLDGAVFLRGPS